MEKSKFVDAIKSGLQNSKLGNFSGCGRVYVMLPKGDRKTLAMYRAAAKETGILYLPEAYGAGKRALYIGYDNANGRCYNQAIAIAENLRSIGISAYEEGVAD